MAEIVETFRGGIQAGRMSRAVEAAAEGTLRVLDGDRSGLAEIDRGCDVLRSAGVRFDLALLRRVRALLAPDDLGASDAAREATTILTELGAVTLLRGLPADAATDDGRTTAGTLAPMPGDPESASAANR